MPGLLGFAGTRGPADAAERFGRTRERMLRHGGMQARSVSACKGACLAGAVDRSRKPAVATGPSFFHGVLHNGDTLRIGLATDRPLESDDELIDAMYGRDGAAFVGRLEGEFCLAVVDEANRRVLVATDTIGSHPVYWRSDADGLIFSSDLSALLAATPSAGRIDIRAVADYLTIGAVLGDRTLAAGVQLLGPGTVLEYDLSNGRVSLRPYVRLESFFAPKAQDKHEYLERVTGAFTTAVDRALGGTPPVGLSLSGGLDSRAILGAVNGRASSLRTYTLGVDGCADQVIARRLAEIAGTTHHFFRLDSSYLRDFLPNMAAMVSATDGMYLSHGLTEMLALRFLDDTGIAVLLRGHGGELAKAHLAWPLHTDERIHAMSSLDQFAPYLSARANYVTRGQRLADILAPDAARAVGLGGSRESFNDALRDTGLSPADACSFLYLRELNRRFTVPSLELFRTSVDVRLPFLDASFLKVLLAAPARWRDGTEIHRALTASGLPRLLRVRNSNTGAPAGAGPLTEYVLDKMNSALKRMNVRGFRHYHDFDAWMRQSLIESVEAELLASSARVQAFVAKKTIANLIRETREGAVDRSYLLQVLLILELWQRENRVEAVA